MTHRPMPRAHAHPRRAEREDVLERFGAGRQRPPVRELGRQQADLLGVIDLLTLRADVGLPG
jgi:hypothetical protein